MSLKIMNTQSTWNKVDNLFYKRFQIVITECKRSLWCLKSFPELTMQCEEEAQRDFYNNKSSNHKSDIKYFHLMIDYDWNASKLFKNAELCEKQAFKRIYYIWRRFYEEKTLMDVWTVKFFIRPCSKRADNKESIKETDLEMYVLHWNQNRPFVQWFVNFGKWIFLKM